MARRHQHTWNNLTDSSYHRNFISRRYFVHSNRQHFGQFSFAFLCQRNCCCCHYSFLSFRRRQQIVHFDRKTTMRFLAFTDKVDAIGDKHKVNQRFNYAIVASLNYILMKSKMIYLNCCIRFKADLNRFTNSLLFDSIRTFIKVISSENWQNCRDPFAKKAFCFFERECKLKLTNRNKKWESLRVLISIDSLERTQNGFDHRQRIAWQTNLFILFVLPLLKRNRSAINGHFNDGKKRRCDDRRAMTITLAIDRSHGQCDASLIADGIRVTFALFVFTSLRSRGCFVVASSFYFCRRRLQAIHSEAFRFDSRAWVVAFVRFVETEIKNQLRSNRRSCRRLNWRDFKSISIRSDKGFFYLFRHSTINRLLCQWIFSGWSIHWATTNLSNCICHRRRRLQLSFEFNWTINSFPQLNEKCFNLSFGGWYLFHNCAVNERIRSI